MKQMNLGGGKRALALSVALLAAGTAGPLQAATTASSLNGRVSDQNGNPVSNAEVVIVHTPSGTRRVVETNESGGFYQGGLRVGGPYEVTFDAPGYGEEEVEGLFLQPGSQAPVTVRLVSDDVAMEEVVVTGQRMVLGRDLTNGIGSSYSAEDISNQPTVQRDVLRTLLRDPLATSDGEGELTVAGVNPRFNGFAIDGSLQQDDFGLSDGTYATSRSPINLDAIESVSLAAADYSVEVSGFTGGLVTVNTKSGTNEFDGSAFYYYRDEDYVGDTADGELDFTNPPFEEEERGFTLGGPIIKDRAFFFVSYDEFESASSQTFENFDERNGIQPGFFDALGQIVEDTTGFAPQSRPLVGNTPVSTERLLVKLDANITDQHRASFTWQDTEEFGTSVDSDEFEGAWYDIPVELSSYTGQLFSDWAPRFSTTLRYNFKEFSRGQNCRAGSNNPEIDINGLDAADAVGTPLEGLFDDDDLDLTAGCDRFRHANVFEDERTQLFAKGDYVWGDHVTTFGAAWEDYELFNLFVPSSNGRVRFFSLPDLIAGDGVVDYVNVPSNDANDGAAAWGYEKTSLFAQDTWQLTQDLELSYGLRYERFTQDEEPDRVQQTFNTYGVDSSENLDGLDLWQPRVSFRYDGIERTTVTGGFGLFAGGNPQVWVSNAFQRPTVFSRSDLPGGPFDAGTIPQANLDAVASGTPVPIDVIADDFEMPADWKASVRVDREFDMQFGGLDLGDDYLVTTQLLYTRVQNGFLWTNLAQTRLPAALPTGTAPDGRPIYADLDDLGILNLTELGNYDEGESITWTIGLQKNFDNGFDFAVNYAFQDIETVTEGGSSRGISNWRGIVAYDRNNPQPHTSPYEIEHAFKVSLGYERDFLPGLTTRFDLFGQILKDDVFTHTFDVDRDNALFGRAGAGESPFDNAPLYVPTGPDDPLVVFGSGFAQQAFFDYVDSKGVGRGLARLNGEEGGWNQIWDLRIQQELPGIPGLSRLVGENRLKLVFDVENFLNLVNDDWGRFTNGPRFGQNAIVGADLVTAADVAANGVDGATALTGDASRTACQAASDCVYRFNEFDGDDISNVSRSRSVYRIRLGIRMDF